MKQEPRARILGVSLAFLFSVSFANLIPLAQGAELYFGAHSQDVGVGKSFEVGVFINTDDESINAVEGKISFPSDLELVDVRDGNSILTLWVKRPELVEPGQISFAGIIPGGYIGNRGYLFSLILRSQKENPIIIKSIEERILLNDSQGTPAEVRRAPLSLTVSVEATTAEFLPADDSEQPESFTPVITRDPNLFDNQYFLTFATQDKGSGVKEYQVQERKFKWTLGGKWITAGSPHLLKDQRLRSYIFVKAIDKAGNERVEVLPPSTPWYRDYLVWVIIILVGLLFILTFRQSKWRRLKR